MIGYSNFNLQLHGQKRKIIKGVLLIFLFLLVLGVCVTASVIMYQLKPTLPLQVGFPGKMHTQDLLASYTAHLYNHVTENSYSNLH